LLILLFFDDVFFTPIIDFDFNISLLSLLRRFHFIAIFAATLIFDYFHFAYFHFHY